MTKQNSVLVVFGERMPEVNLDLYDSVFSGEELKKLIGPGSIYEASAMLEELARLTLNDSTRLSKAFVYEDYELWWINYNNIFQYFCLPYTQYRKLLEYLKDFKEVCLFNPPYQSLFSCYLKVYGCEITMLNDKRLKSPTFLPFGVLLQIIITLLSLPMLLIKQYHLMVFTGDKFEKDKDYDFRMKFVYEELRRRKIPFVEFIRGIEPWKNVLKHAWKRKRLVIYSEAVVFLGRFLSFVTRKHVLADKQFGLDIIPSGVSSEEQFKFRVATQYLLTVYDDVWSIRIMSWILRIIGIKVAFIPAASERSFHTVLACKLSKIPMVGIMHGVQSRHYNMYDFMPGFDGTNVLSVDKFGVWSAWWLGYYRKHSRAYKPEQLFVSGPMRPLIKSDDPDSSPNLTKGKTRVLFVSEEVAVPQEVLPYLYKLLVQDDLEVTLKFRPYRDGFEQWLLAHEPGILEHKNLHIARGNMREAINNCDVVVGCYSTGVLEALLELKVPIYFQTKKWGDYYSLKEYDEKHTFFAEDVIQLLERIRNIQSVSKEMLRDLQERYFGDPYKNGSKWVVDEVEKLLPSREESGKSGR